MAADAFPVPVDEDQRLRTLDAYRIVDTERDARFEDLVAEVARECDVPIATITFLDAQRQWFKASVGIDLAETGRDVAICAYTILDTDRPLVIPDTTRDPRFRDNPLVVGDPGLMAYAGAPIVAPDGTALGTVCAIDLEPHEYSPAQLETLARVSRRVVELLETGRAAAEFAAGRVGTGPQTPAAPADPTTADPSLGLTRPLIEAIGEDLDVVALVEDFCGAVLTSFGWWAARVAWVQGDKLQPGDWQVLQGSPASLAALEGRSAPSSELDDLGVAFAEPDVLDVSMLRWISDRDVLTALGARHAVVIDVPGATSLAARIVFLVPTARALDSASARTLTTAAAVLPRVIVQQRARQELTYRATHDALTGLRNREGLERSHRGTSDKAVFHRAVLYLDVDDFKRINDGHGHRAGDEVLIRIARLLGAHLRPTDTIVRLGGDEFVVVLEGIEDDSEVARVAERLLRALNGPATVLRTLTVDVAVSIGVLRWTGGPLDGAIERADRLMYSAKELGGGRAALEGEDGRRIIGGGDDGPSDLDAALDGALTVHLAAIVDCTEDEEGRSGRVGVRVDIASALRHPDVTGLADALVEAVLASGSEGPLAGERAGTLLRIHPSRELWAIDGLVVRLLVAVRERLPGMAIAIGVGPRTLVTDRDLDAAAAVRDGLGLPLVLTGFGAGFGELGLIDRLRPSVIELAPSVVADWLASSTADAPKPIPSALVAAKALAHERGVALSAAVPATTTVTPEGEDRLDLARHLLGVQGISTLVLLSRREEGPRWDA